MDFGNILLLSFIFIDDLCNKEQAKIGYLFHVIQSRLRYEIIGIYSFHFGILQTVISNYDLIGCF